MRAYLDASVLVALIADEPMRSVAAGFVEVADELLVSDFAAGEVASALSRLVRMEQVASEAATRRLAAFDLWLASAATPIGVDAPDIRLASQIVRRFDLQLRMPDAIHAAMAQAHGLTLATFDRRLAQAADALGIAHVIPS